MKISLNAGPVHQTIENIKCGDTFTYQGGAYMKVPECREVGGLVNCNALKLSNGRHIAFDRQDPIEPRKMKVVDDEN
ncbi:MAG: hypothetical protein ACRDCE_05935 [Cetobacterium sp.]|uniref:hypothetical protein n=1 Tax=Cetobacterium sp. TaxID=2071632 RepID=UPI003EE7E39D